MDVVEEKGNGKLMMSRGKTTKTFSAIAVATVLVAVLLIGLTGGVGVAEGREGKSAPPCVATPSQVTEIVGLAATDQSGVPNQSETRADEVPSLEDQLSNEEADAEKLNVSETETSSELPSLYLDLNGTICEVPAFSGAPSVEINGGQPTFTDFDLAQPCLENYSRLDRLGRCGSAIAHVCESIMPTEERGDIQSVHPSGWQSAQYDFIEGGSLFNRGHLIGFQLAGENANEKNLITCTRFMNVEGMLPYENQVANFVKSTGQSVLLRVTPIFEGDNLVASGVVMEALSVEDGGVGLAFAVYCYNVQPGVIIDYATGENQMDPDALAASMIAAAEGAEGFEFEDGESVSGTEGSSADVTASYVANLNTKKFHYPSCSSVSDMADHNRWDFEGSREELVNQGYVPCKRCNP